jgi:thiol-disulfide isomerase/thioredoxin
MKAAGVRALLGAWGDRRRLATWVCAVAMLGSASWSLAQSTERNPAGVDVVPGTAPENPASSIKQVPIVEVDAPKHDFGEVWQGDALKHTFEIRNGGDAPLRIVRVKPACGCTVAGKYPKEIAPGESGAFPFQLNTKRLAGKFTKSIAVTTNDTKSAQTRLLLTGEVKQHVDVAPRLAQFGRVKPDSVITRKITLTNNTSEPLKLLVDPTQDLKCFKAQVEELVPGKKFELNVTAAPPFQTGINRINLRLATGIKQQEKLEITCIATLPKRIEMRPDKIQVPEVTRSETVRKIWMANNGEAPVNITSVASTDTRLAVDYKEVEAGRKYQLSVTVPEGYGNPADDAAILIETDDDKTALVRLPIKAKKKRTPVRPKRPAMTMLGKPAPEHATQTFRGDELKIGNGSDKVQLLAFYASWCGFCKRALPQIEGLQKKYANNPEVEVVAINLDDRAGRRARTEAKSIEHYEQMKLTMPMVLDSDKKLGRPYKVVSYPTMFVVGKTGTIEAVHVGARAGFDKTIAKQIDALLEGKTRADFGKAVSSRIVGPRLENEPPIKQASVRPSARGQDTGSGS